MGRTKQIQKTQTAKTVTHTAISQKQSLQAVQTLIHGGLSCVTFLRELFAEKAFDCRFYQMGSITPYEDYANGKLPTNKERAAKPSTKLQLLRRNRSRRVDTFLDWLETVAFPLLANGKLQAIQIYVHQDQDRDKIMEAYTFTIKYHPDGSGVKVPAGIEVGGDQETPEIVGYVNSDLQQVLRAIEELCGKLPILPAKRFVSMDLSYFPGNDSQSDDRLPGFAPSRSDKLRFAHADGWRKETAVMETLSSSFHSTLLKVSHLSIPDFDPSAGRPSIPQELEYPEPAIRTGELDLSAANEDDAAVIDNSCARASSTREETPSTSSRGVPAKRRPQRLSTVQTATPAPTSQVVTRAATRQKRSNPAIAESQDTSLNAGPAVWDNFDTQSSHVRTMRNALQSMRQSEPLTQGDTQTQAIMRLVPQTPSELGRQATPTTASGLDLRASVAPYQTPALPSFNQGKRYREDDVFSIPSSRASSNTPVFKRLKSVQSLTLLNANGLSSSPGPPPGR